MCFSLSHTKLLIHDFPLKYSAIEMMRLVDVAAVAAFWAAASPSALAIDSMNTSTEECDSFVAEYIDLRNAVQAVNHSVPTTICVENIIDFDTTGPGPRGPIIVNHGSTIHFLGLGDSGMSHISLVTKIVISTPPDHYNALSSST
jgi:hypothetical protein